MTAPAQRDSRILVVDDDEVELEYTLRQIRKAGFQAAGAASGALALSQAAEIRPDIVLLDVVMAPPDGLEVCRQLKSGGGAGGPLVLLVSSMRISAEARIRGFAVGADGYLRRPHDGAELIAELEAYARLRPGGGARVTSRADLARELGRLLEVLERQRQQLDAQVAAVRTLVQRIREAADEEARPLVENLRSRIQPLLRRIAERSGPVDRALLEVLERELVEAGDGFGVALGEPAYGLSGREKEICSLVRAGQASKEIAGLLGLSLHTVSAHRRRIRRKLGLGPGVTLELGLQRLAAATARRPAD